MQTLIDLLPPAVARRGGGSPRATPLLRLRAGAAPATVAGLLRQRAAELVARPPYPGSPSDA
jgi:hypothetical protein